MTKVGASQNDPSVMLRVNSRGLMSFDRLRMGGGGYPGLPSREALQTDGLGFFASLRMIGGVRPSTSLVPP